jgi:uncharacterized protein DUF664
VVLPTAARPRPGTPVGLGGLGHRPRLGLALGADDSPEQLSTLWQDAVDRSRSLVTEALADGGLERPAAWIDDFFGEAPSQRWILLHMTREYARHCGHADLLRESVDGLTGE